MASFDIYVSAFHVSAEVPTFTLLLSDFPAITERYFQIGFVCVISAQVSSNVLALQAVWD
ncbi:hypothetical protein [Flavobacterium sp. A45]|uniref:hypothetical protein n=1 Tax=Flavobacterium sp. A45 TaxID=1945862 RepID=UPI000985C685|nr:hypothetical protein [Flavobacterium sp. A45]OOG75541.1 hypothetical protein B0E44_05105 [Flavobacterium sp. A45]